MSERAVPPTDTSLVLILGVLRVVDQEVGAGGNIETRRPSRGLREAARAECGLVIRDYARTRPASAIRYPRVGPGWMTRAELTTKGPIAIGSPVTSCNVTDGRSRRRTGKSGGER
jgi:hypothetical protein